MVVTTLHWTLICFGIVIVLGAAGLVPALYVSSKNNANKPKKQVTRPVPPPASSSTNMGGTEACSPLSSGYKTLVPCKTQDDCATGCVERVDGFPYECVLANNGNNFVDESGKLVTPLVVPYKVPASSAECSGNGKRDAGNNSKCVCESGFTGDNCDLFNLEISTTGSYCLPPYMNKCDATTSDTVLSARPGSMGWTCQCKGKYANLLTQKVEGGECDTPLVCDTTQPQYSANHTLQQFNVFTKTDEQTGEALFAKAPVYPNRIVSYNPMSTSPCVSKTTDVIPVNTGALSYATRLVDPDADPTCTPTQFTNKCTSVVSVTRNGEFGLQPVEAVVRGSGRANDPLLTRVTPPFFVPVPKGLQMCPDHFSGKNTADSPCVCACKTGKTGQCCDGKTSDCVPCTNGVPTGEQCDCFPGDVLQLKVTDRSFCSAVYDPSGVDLKYGGDWIDSAFAANGELTEWNGKLTCMRDLRYAQVGVKRSGVDGDGKPVDFRVVLDNVKWHTVDNRSRYRLKDPVCEDNDVFADRGDYDAALQQFAVTDNCVGPSCLGVQGSRRASWDGARDGPLVDATNKELPWFATPDGQYGGQCECLRKVSKTGTTGTAMMRQVSQYMVPSEGEESWWACALDNCSASSADPSSHLDMDNPLVAYPRCVCASTLPTSGGAAFKSEISFREQSTDLPSCIADPCNPDGVKTNVQMMCKDSVGLNSDCAGTCYKNRCYYTPGGAAAQCTNDSDCLAEGEANNFAGLPMVCAKSGTSATGKCMVADAERLVAGSTCQENSDCDYGTCTNTDDDGVGTCSGGCACKPTSVQQYDNRNPLGYVCADRCSVYPCFNESKCSINVESGAQVCECNACFKGDKCGEATGRPRHNQSCTNDMEHGGCCDPNFSACRIPDMYDPTKLATHTSCQVKR